MRQSKWNPPTTHVRANGEKPKSMDGVVIPKGNPYYDIISKCVQDKMKNEAAVY